MADDLWEYRELSGWFDKDLGLQLTTMGALGWEAVGLGIVQLGMAKDVRVVLVKRRITGLPAPEQTAAGWLPDPARRHHHRYWDGIRWSEHVMSRTGEQTQDLPLP